MQTELGRIAALTEGVAVDLSPLERQVRIEGTVARLSDDESLAYFRTRPRESQIGALDQIQRQFNVHLAFDGGAAHFAIALRRMRVADREESALDLYGQIERG